MAPIGDYIITFCSILFGLAVGDILVDFNRRLRHGKKVRWHPLPILATAYILLISLLAWWSIYNEIGGTTSARIVDFLPLFARLCIIFLIAAAALPGEVEEGLDLKAYYFDNHRRFYGLFVILSLLLIVPPLAFGLRPSVAQLFLPVRTFVLCAILAWTRTPIVHWILLPFLLVSFAYFRLGSTIAG